MKVTVKDLVSSYLSADKDAMPVEVYVSMVSNQLQDGTPNVLEGWYREAPYMYNDASVSNWCIKPSDKMNRWGDKFVTLYISATNF